MLLYDRELAVGIGETVGTGSPDGGSVGRAVAGRLVNITCRWQAGGELHYNDMSESWRSSLFMRDRGTSLHFITKHLNG